MQKMWKKATKIMLSLLLGFSTFSSMLSTLSVKVEAAGVEVEKEGSYTQYVDPFVCTDVDYGQLFPGSVVPNGLVKLSPDTYPHDTIDHVGYDYSKLQIQGFSHTRVEGVGGQGAGGDVLVTPTYVTYTKRPTAASKAMAYTKDKESAKPGYYSVELTPNVGSDASVSKDTSIGNIKAEMTTDIRTGYHRYTFPKAGEVNILTDLNFTYHGTDVRDAILDVLEESSTTTAIGGRFSGKNVSGNGKYTLYFYMETSKPTKKVQTWNGETLSDVKNQTGNDIGSIFTFDVEDNEVIELKVSISTISVEQAKIDMHNEVPNWNFDAVYANADAAWNNLLGKVRIENSATSDPTGELKKLFYTHLYHMYMTPVNATSTSGTYRGTDGKIYEANDYVHYDSWTLWDDYRKYAMIGLIEPETYKDMIQSIADALNTGIVTWSHNLQTVPNVRTEHAVALLADGIAKGHVDIDGLEGAYEAAKKVANDAITSSVEAQGYFTTRVDKTAEYAYDDWCLSIVAAALGKVDESAYFLERSMNYKNTFRKDAVASPFSSNSLGLLWNKKADGTWSTSSPTKIGADSLYQGSMWQYTWYDSNDINGLMELMGGEQMMLEALMYMFGMQDTSDGSKYLHNAANEVELNLPYFFNYVGRADLTQYWIRKIYTGVSYNTGYASGNVEAKMYRLAPDGYLETMDDDAGTMAMMFVSSAMGIFPMTPGDTAFQIGTPFFDKMTLEVGNGKTFTIIADGVSSENYYIQSATLNGETFNRTWLDYSELTNGGVLSFVMGSSASDWGSDSVTAPSSSDFAPTSYSDEDVIQYSTGTFEEAGLNDGSIGNTITIHVSNTTFTGNVGDDLIANGSISVANVPSGLSAKAIKEDDNTVVLQLAGKANMHTANNSISNMAVTIHDAAVEDASVIADSVRKNKTNVRISFANVALAYSTTKLNESIEEKGTIDGSVTITLNGNATFTGNVDENFVSAGKVSVLNVPAGLKANLIKKDDKTLTLSFDGYAYDEDYDVKVSISFNDAAFNGASANAINNASLTGMNAFVLDFFKDYSEALKACIEKAENVDVDDYSSTSYDALMDKVEEAKALLSNGSEAEMKSMITELIYAMENLVLKAVRDAADKLEGEKPDALSDGKNTYNSGALKLENVNLGNTYDGAWVAYYNVDFSVKDIEKVEVRYSGSGNCVSDARMEVRLDGVDGELIATVPMAPTGSWSSWNTISSEISKTLDGVHDVYLVMRGSTDPTKYYYIANVDYAWFKEKEVVVDTGEILDSYKIEFESVKNSSAPYWSGNGLKTEAAKNEANVAIESVVAGTTPNQWLKYENVDFNKFIADTISVRYVNNSTRCKPDAKLSFYLDSMDSTPFVEIALEPSGTSWNNYRVVTEEITKKISGKHTVYVKMTASQGSNPYIANLDYFTFAKKDVTAPYRIEFEDKQTISGNNSGNVKVESKTDTDGNTLVNIGGLKNGTWLKYDKIDFDAFGSNELYVRYAKNTNCAEDSKIEFYVDSLDSTPIASIDLAYTNSWSAYATAKTKLASKISGVHTVYVKVSGSTTGSKPNISNFDWFEFRTVAKADSYKVEFESVKNSSEPYWSGNGLKTENSTDANNDSLVNVGGTTPNQWLKYENLNFDKFAAGEIVVRYVNNSTRCKPDAKLDFYLDNMDGTPFVSVALPATGSNWKAYKEVIAQIPYAVSGTHTVYVKMSASEGSNPYIANLDYFTFRKATSYKIEFEKDQVKNGTNWSGGSLKTESSNGRTNVGGSYVGGWLKYNNVDFSSISADEIVVCYAGKGSNTNADATLYFYLDDMNEEPFAVVSTPPTNQNNWSNYVEVTQKIAKDITGVHTVYVVMDGSNPSKYVANLDYFTFNYKEEVVKSDVTQLEEAISTAKGYVGLSSLYEVESISRLEYLLEDAEALDEDSAQHLIDEAVQRINQGISLLVYRIINDLAQLIERVEKLDAQVYLTDSFETLAAPLQNAKDVTNDTFNLEAYYDAYDALLNAYNALEKVADTKKLEKVLADAKAKDETSYTEASYAVLVETVNTVEEVMLEEMSQSVADEAVVALKKALNSLVDITALKEIVEAVEKEDTSKFSEESVNALKEALENAKNAMIDGSEADVNNAKEALLEAYDALEVKKPEKDPGTGDTTNVGGLLAMLLASAYILSKRRKA